MSDLAAWVNLLNCRAGGEVMGVAEGPQQMLLMLNTICVILHHILQHLIHQHFAVFGTHLSHTPSRNLSALFNNTKHLMHVYVSLVKLFQIINRMETGWLLYTFMIVVLVLNTVTESAGPSDMPPCVTLKNFTSPRPSPYKTWLL